jgi:dTDP-glucose 4,6-dehydratase
LAFHQGEMDRFQFPTGAFTHVIHAATENYPATVGPECLAVFDRNIQGTRRVLDFACSCGVRRFLLTSSGAVYGRQPSDLPCVPEEYAGGPDPLDVHLGYGQGKRVSEYLCALYAASHDLEIAIARCFAFVGPYLPLDSNFAIGNFLRDALAGGPIKIQGDGSPRRSYLYAADLAIWLWTILLRGTPCRAYNVGSDVEVSIAELAKKVVAVVNPQAEVHIALPCDPNRPVARYVPAIRRVREELGLDVFVALDDAIARTAAWRRSNSG